MAQHGRLGERIELVAEDKIGVAQADTGDPHQHLARRAIDRDLFDREIRMGGPRNGGGADSHQALLFIFPRRSFPEVPAIRFGERMGRPQQPAQQELRKMAACHAIHRTNLIDQLISFSPFVSPLGQSGARTILSAPASGCRTDDRLPTLAIAASGG
jgi:hypothetical protein